MSLTLCPTVYGRKGTKMNRNNDSLNFDHKSHYNDDRDSYIDKNGNYVYTQWVKVGKSYERRVVDIIPLTEENRDIIILLDGSDHDMDLQDRYGSYITITADFRKYPCVEDSIADHSAYLNGAKNGSNLRYAGLKGSTDYKKAIQIIKDGGYATDQKYVDKIVSIIERWNLTQYDLTSASPAENTAEHLYRVRKSWADASSQVGAYSILSNAKEACDKHPGYSVFDENGKAVYKAAGSKFPYLVRINISDLNIREKPTANSKSHGFTGKGVFTIVEEQDGWGLLKSYAKKKNGWIKLSYAEKL